MDERIVLRKSCMHSDIRLVDYGSSDDSGEDKTKDQTGCYISRQNDTLHAGSKRRSDERTQAGISSHKKLCANGHNSGKPTSKTVEILDENANKWSIINVCDIPLPSDINYNRCSNTSADKRDTCASSNGNIQSSTPRLLLGRTVSFTSQNTSRKVVNSVSHRVQRKVFPPSSDKKVIPPSSEKKVIPPSSVEKVIPPSSVEKVMPPFSVEKSSNFTPSKITKHSFSSPAPFWSNSSPQSELNSPLYGYNSPPSPVVSPSSSTSGFTPTWQPSSLVSTPVKGSTSSKNSSFTEKSGCSVADNTSSSEAYFLSPSQVFLTSSHLSPRLRFLQNSCLVNKDKSPVSTENKNTADTTEWKKQFKQTSDSYGVCYIDSHCHLDFLIQRSQFKGSWDRFRTLNSDTFPSTYEGCVAVFCSPASFKPEGLWKNIASSEGVWLAFGCHPKSATDFTATAEAGLYKCLSHSKVVALGEIGLDYSGTFRQHEEIQKEVLRKQIRIALNLNKPLVIHCRDADDDCFSIVTEMLPRNYKIHCHCFTGDFVMAKRWLDTFPNLYIGMTPLVTYKTAAPTHNVARFIPLDRLLLETDAPYFIPRKIPKDEMTHSHPGMAVTVAEQVAYIKGCSVQEVLLTCRQNTRNMYGI